MGVEPGPREGDRPTAEPGPREGDRPAAEPAPRPDEPRDAQPDARSALERRIDRAPPEPLNRRQLALAGAFVGILYAAGAIAQGEVLPGIVGGVLAGILCFLVLREVGNRQRRRIAARERKRSGG